MHHQKSLRNMFDSLQPPDNNFLISGTACSGNALLPATTRYKYECDNSDLTNNYNNWYWFISDVIARQVKVTNLTKMPKIQIVEFCNNHHMRHAYWSWLIRCANMIRTRLVLWKTQSGHDFVHRWTDGRTDDVKPVYPPSTSLKRRVWLVNIL